MSSFGQVARDASFENCQISKSSAAGSLTAKTTHWRVIEAVDSVSPSFEDSGALIHLAVTVPETGAGAATITLPAPTQDGTVYTIIGSYPEHGNTDVFNLTITTVLGNTPTGDARPFYGMYLYALEQGGTVTPNFHYFANIIYVTSINSNMAFNLTFRCLGGKWLFDGFVGQTDD